MHNAIVIIHSREIYKEIPVKWFNDEIVDHQEFVKKLNEIIFVSCELNIGNHVPMTIFLEEDFSINTKIVNVNGIFKPTRSLSEIRKKVV